MVPPFICELELLEILLASDNKLVSLPEEIGRLQRLMHLVRSRVISKRVSFFNAVFFFFLVHLTASDSPTSAVTIM